MSLTVPVAAVLGYTAVWELIVFPLLVGWGAGLAVTPARPPQRGNWWQIWKA